MSYYGRNTATSNSENAKVLAREAFNKADADVNFDLYDNDGDGNVDGVYIIFAGYGEEAGGDANTIWSHASSTGWVNLDNVKASSYSCSPEYRSNSGTNLTSIGVICHEFGHTLGAPDYYDSSHFIPDSSKAGLAAIRAVCAFITAAIRPFIRPLKLSPHTRL